MPTVCTVLSGAHVQLSFRFRFRFRFLFSFCVWHGVLHLPLSLPNGSPKIERTELN